MTPLDFLDKHFVGVTVAFVCCFYFFCITFGSRVKVEMRK